MPLMEWNDTMSVGIDSIDKQHQKLVGMLNELYDGMHEGKSREALGEVLEKLSAYTVEHFAYEENLFSKTGYPETKAHKKEHDDLIQQVKQIQERYKTSATGVLSLEVFNFLKHWLTSHIMVVDKKYTAHMTEHGVS